MCLILRELDISFCINYFLFSKHRYLKISLDKTNEFKCDNILLIKLHQREIHNGRFRYGDVSQHDAMTSKNTGFAVRYPYPHTVHDDGRWHLSLILGVNITK